jgi:hypothetical protein
MWNLTRILKRDDLWGGDQWEEREMDREYYHSTLHPCMKTES